MANNGYFDDIYEILNRIASRQDQHDKILRQHSEMLAEHAKVMAEHDQRMAEHDQRMAEHDERMDRVGRHLEVLANICDDLIRNKADRKRPRGSA